MSKIVLISGSNRKGNTEYILKALNENLQNSEVILLREQKIKFCKGCLSCHNKDNCIINDNMSKIIAKLQEAELIIFGVPNYFDNVSGIFKNFIDRLHPLYKSEKLKGKKVIFIYVGGGKEIGTLETLHQATKGIEKYLQINVLKEFSFKALNSNDMMNQKEKIDEILKVIKNYI